MSRYKDTASADPIGTESLTNSPIHSEQDHSAPMSLAEKQEEVNQFDDAEIRQLKDISITNPSVKRTTRILLKQHDKNNTATTKDDGTYLELGKVRNVKKNSDEFFYNAKNRRRIETKKGAKGSESSRKNAKKFVQIAAETSKELLEDKEAILQFSKDHEESINVLEESAKSFWERIQLNAETAIKQGKQVVVETPQFAIENAKKVVQSTRRAVQNPAVIGQIVLGLGAAAIGYIAFVERKNRINTDSKVVLGVQASIIAGLILFDGYVFTKAYKKFDKDGSL